MNFDQAPMLVIWEVTQACDLACVHCRASAQPERNSNELTTEQGYRLLDQIKSFGNPLMVFTGGDPLKRPDLFYLIRHSVKIGLRTNVTPSATPLLTPEAIRRLKDSGIARMAISLDGPDAPRMTIPAASLARSIAPCLHWTRHSGSGSTPNCRRRSPGETWLGWRRSPGSRERSALRCGACSS